MYSISNIINNWIEAEAFFWKKNQIHTHRYENILGNLYCVDYKIIIKTNYKTNFFTIIAIYTHIWLNYP